MQTPRHVWPPLRRWSARHALARHLAEPDAIIAHARSLPAADAAAVITGAVEAADHLPAQPARHVIDVALDWGHKSPRKAALERLRAWGETDRAYAVAAKDPDASIRRWATRLTSRDVQAQLFDPGDAVSEQRDR